VQVNTPFTLQVVWDRLSHQFLASVGKNALVAQPYQLYGGGDDR